jgi:FKBP-type peptidyl-prolyl cis-trans isomerase FklB
VFRELEAGTGARPAEEDTVTVHYEGRLADGSVFDSSVARGEPVEFPLGGVIAGRARRGPRSRSPAGFTL